MSELMLVSGILLIGNHLNLDRKLGTVVARQVSMHNSRIRNFDDNLYIFLTKLHMIMAKLLL